MLWMMLLVDYLWVVYPMLRKKRKELVKDVHRLARLGVRLISISDSGVIVQNEAESSLIEEVKEKQESDPILPELKGEMVYFITKVD